MWVRRRKLKVYQKLRFRGERMVVIAVERLNGDLRQIYLRNRRKTWEGWVQAEELNAGKRGHCSL